MLTLFLRSSSLGALSICEQKYFLVYALGLKDKQNSSAKRGTVLHRVMQALGDKNIALKQGKKTIDFEGKRIKLDKCDDLEYLTRLSLDYYNQADPEIILGEKDYKDCLSWAYKATEENNGALDPRNQNVFKTEQFFDFTIEEDWAKYDFQIGDKRLVGNLGLKGTIDLILTENENTLHLQDFKTGKRKNWATFKEKTYEDLEYDTQLLLYYYALKNLYPDKDFWVSIYYINDGGLFSFVYDEHHYEIARDMLKQKFEYIKNVEIPRLASPENTAPACKYMCAFSQPHKSGKTICQFFHEEIKQKGIDNVVAEYADFEALGKYTGGGRIDQ